MSEHIPTEFEIEDLIEAHVDAMRRVDWWIAGTDTDAGKMHLSVQYLTLCNARRETHRALHQAVRAMAEALVRATAHPCACPGTPVHHPSCPTRSAA